MSLMLAAPAQALAEAAAKSPLDGTGIEPNVVSYVEYRDPLIRFNRAIFKFNDVSFRYVLIPAAHAYQVLPSPMRTGVGNFFDNIKTPIPLVNHLLQGQPRKAGTSFGRFLINSTIGVAGIFDPATAWFHIERKNTGFDETLTQYGVNYGPYLVLPLVGPGTIREGSGLLGDGLLNPLAYVINNPESIGVRAFDEFQEIAPSVDGYLKLREESQDLYIFMRNLHLQGLQRDAEFK